MCIRDSLQLIHRVIRFSLSEENTLEEADYAVDQLKEIVRFLRNMSPLYNEFLKDQEA